MLNYNLKCLIFYKKLFFSSNNSFKQFIPVTFDDRTTITPDVTYGFETWPSRLTDERILKVFENWVMRNIL